MPTVFLSPFVSFSFSLKANLVPMKLICVLRFAAIDCPLNVHVERCDDCSALLGYSATQQNVVWVGPAVRSRIGLALIKMDSMQM